MNTKTIVFILTITFVAISTAKPLVTQDLDSNEKNPSHPHKLFKRAAASDTKSSSKTGFAAIIETPKTKNHKKTRECLEWKKQPLTGKLKCIKFTVHSQNSDLTNDIGSQFHKFIKRAAVGTVSSSKTGFAAIIETPNTENHKKTRKCLEWEKQPLTGKMKCIKLTIISKKN